MTKHKQVSKNDRQPGLSCQTYLAKRAARESWALVMPSIGADSPFSSPRDRVSEVSNL
jgi:hypothetical protein